MAINQFTYRPADGLKNKTSFPDDPGSGEALRAGIQGLFDQAASALNALTTLLAGAGAAGEIGAGAHGDITAGTVQAFLNALCDTRVSFKSNDARYIRVNGDRQLETSPDGASWQATGSSGHIIIDSDGNTLAQRARLRFANCSVSDDGTQTVVHGVKGDTGETGAAGAAGPKGETGPKGDAGPAWLPSVDQQGVLSFTLSDAGTPPPPASIRGPQGPQGVQGPQGSIGAQGVQGLQGPRGPQGLPGADGADGRSFVLLGSYAGMAALLEAHPTGAAGDAYAIDGESGVTVALWDTDAQVWKNIGALRGPQGIQGIQGPEGAQGVQGVQGVPGTAGKSAFSAAQEGGYTGTEAAFNQSLAGLDGMARKKVPAAAGNLAALDSTGGLADSGKKPADFDPAGSAEAVRGSLSTHTGNTQNPHGVTAAQVGADPAGSASSALTAAKAYTDGQLGAFSVKPFYAGATAPENTNLLWIDTQSGGVLKYHNGTGWVLVAAAYS